MFDKLLFSNNKIETRDNSLTADIINWLSSTDEVTADTAMTVPTINALVHIIAGTLSTLPVELVDKNGIPKNDYREKLLNLECGDLLSSQEVKYMIIRDYLLVGSGYYYPFWSGTKVTGISYLKPLSVGISSNGMNLHKEGFFTVDGKEIQTQYMGRILRNSVGGLKGRGICQDLPGYINLLINLQNLQSRTSKTGGKLLLQPSLKLSQDALTNLKTAWNRLYDSATGESVMILNNEIVANQLQSLVSSETSNVETGATDKIATALGVPSKVLYGGATASDYALFKNNALLPLIRILETSFDRFLLLEREKGKLHFKVNTDGLTLESLAERMQGYSAALTNSVMSIGEVRTKEGMPPLPKDYMHLNLASVLWDPNTDELFVANTGQTKVLGQAEPEPEEDKQEEVKDDGTENSK